MDNLSLVSDSEASGSARYRKAGNGKQSSQARGQGPKGAAGDSRREASTLSRILRSVGARGSKTAIHVDGFDSSTCGSKSYSHEVFK